MKVRAIGITVLSFGCDFLCLAAPVPPRPIPGNCIRIRARIDVLVVLARLDGLAAYKARIGFAHSVCVLSGDQSRTALDYPLCTGLVHVGPGEG